MSGVSRTSTLETEPADLWALSPSILRQKLKGCHGLADRTSCGAERVMGKALLIILLSNHLANDQVRSALSLCQGCQLVANLMTDFYLHN